MPYRAFSDADAHTFAQVVSDAFAVPVERVPGWWDIIERGNLRVVEQEGRIVAGLADIPMGFFAGGRSVPLHGVAGVAVSPGARGRGVGREMMTAYLRELHGAGVGLSALYASTRSFYRGVGYGIGGRSYRAKVRTAAWREVGDLSGHWRKAGDGDWAAIEALYRRLGASGSGWMDRGPYLWSRVRAYRGVPNAVWVLERDDVLVAWVALRTVARDDDWIGLEIVDHGTIDHAATRKLVGFLGGHAAMSPEAEIACGPEEPLLDLLPEAREDVRLFEPWMLRVVHVPNALTQRGWAQGQEIRVAFQVDDPLPENRGPWSLEIAEGVALVTPVERAALTVHCRGLAGLYTGEASVTNLRRRGLVDGSDAALGAFAAAFAGSTPSIQDYF